MSSKDNQVLEILYHQTGHTKGISVIQNFDGKIFTGGQDGRICIWDGELEKEFGCIYAHNSEITDIQRIQNSNYFISSSQELELKLWSLDNLSLIKTIKAHSSTIIGAKPWKNYIISGGRDHALKKWRFENESLVEEIRIKIPDMERFFISDNHIIISNHDGLISVLDAEDFKFIKYLNIDNSRLIKAIKKANKYLKSFSKSDTRALLFQMSRINGIPSMMGRIEGDNLILGHQFGLVSFWNKEKNRLTDVFFTQDNHISGIEFDDEILYSTALDSTIVKFNLNTKTPTVVKKLEQRPLSLLMNSSGKLIVGLESGNILVMDSNLEILKSQSRFNAISNICISPDNVVIATNNGIVSLLNLSNLDIIMSKKIHERPIIGLLYYENRLISIGEDKKVFIFDTNLEIIKEFTLDAKPTNIRQTRHYISLTSNLVLDLKKDDIIKGEISKQTEKELMEFNLFKFRYTNGDVSIFIDKEITKSSNIELLSEHFPKEIAKALEKLIQNNPNIKYYKKNSYIVMKTDNKELL